MVFQNYALFPNMSVADNVGFGLRVRGVGRQSEIAAARRRGAGAGAAGRAWRIAGRTQLSGGQRQRVALARAIVTKPRVLLLDEPLSALDKALRVALREEIRRLQLDLGITTIFVTHDQEEALTLSDQIGILKEGRLIRHGAPRAVYNDPGDVFSARFLGEANIFAGVPEAGGLRLADGCLVDTARPETGMIAVRPENMTITRAPPLDGNRMRANLVQRIFSGAMATCVLDWQGQVIKVVARDQDLVDLPETGPVWLVLVA